MPRKARVVLPGVPVHAVARAHSRSPIFLNPNDHAEFMELMRRALLKHPVELHAYVLMSNHIHLLATPESAQQLAQFMGWLGLKYAFYFNRLYDRTGSLWEGRYRTSVIDTDRYLLSCYRYIELNPLRAGMCNSPEQYAWSSYRHNGLGQNDAMLTPHQSYLAIHHEQHERCRLYAALCSEGMSVEEGVKIREGIRKGRPI